MHLKFLQHKLEERRAINSLRVLKRSTQAIDFCSNDYLGVSRNRLININNTVACHGSTGSRLLSGNYNLIEEAEEFVCKCHNAEAGLIFNSGYDANIGLLSCVPKKGDAILYDELIHASARDGMRLSFATSYRFRHNDADDLKLKLWQLKSSAKEIFVLTESVFSMDGDIAPLEKFSELCEAANAHLIVDEAHATGVTGPKGFGLVQQFNLEQNCFGRLHTFGKACGAHGAIILGSKELKQYLINFSRPFIYSTALPPVAVEAIIASYQVFPRLETERDHLNILIKHFRARFKETSNKHIKILDSETAIQGVLIPGNENVRAVASHLQQNDLDVRPILYPSVPKLGERLRIVLHSFNTIEQIDTLCNSMSLKMFLFMYFSTLLLQ